MINLLSTYLAKKASQTKAGHYHTSTNKTYIRFFPAMIHSDAIASDYSFPDKPLVFPFPLRKMFSIRSIPKATRYNSYISKSIEITLKMLESLCLTLTYIFFMPSRPSSAHVAIRQLSRIQKVSVLCANCVPSKNVVCFVSAGIVRESGHAAHHQTAPAHSQTALSGLL